MRITINHKFASLGRADAGRPPTGRMVRVAEMFGIGLDESHEAVLYDGLVLDVRRGDVVFITGPSGTGKSVLLGLVARALASQEKVRLTDLGSVSLEADSPLIELLDRPLEEALRLFSTAGLADAFLLLRRPRELSDGQRWRLRLALAIERCRTEGGGWPILVADEFASTLDRLCARALAYRLRRLADAEGLTVLAASAHEDVVEDLAPDVLIIKHEGAGVEVAYADPCGRAEP